MTPAGYAALNQVHEQREMRSTRLWAVERAEFRNAHRMWGDVELPWTGEDVLNPADREARVIVARAEKIESDLAFTKMQRRMADITSQSAPEELLPSWAKRQWDPKDYPHLFGGQPVG